jgi:hypothetical protein
MDLYRISVSALVLTLAAGVYAHAGLGPGPDALAKAFDQARTGYDKRYPAAPSNDAGILAWVEASWLDKVLSVYEATGKTAYLDYFLGRAKQALAARDSITNARDYAGNSPPAWPSDGHYTIGKMEALDAQGHVALVIESAGRSHNNATVITLKPDAGGNCVLTATNSHSKIKETWTLAPTRESIRSINERSQLLRLYEKSWPRSGASLKAFGPVTPPTGRMVFSVHTGMISMNLARFAEIVKKRNLKQYSEQAKTLAEAARRALAFHDSEWHEVDGRGYYYYTYGQPAAFDGYPCPNNYTCAMGRAFIYLNRYDPKPEYHRRIEAIARGLKADMRIDDHGCCTWHYWPNVAIDLKPVDVKSVHCPQPPILAGAEDISHGAIDVQFTCMACADGIVLDATDIDALARTLGERVLKRDGTLAFNVSGDRTGKSLPSGWLSLLATHPELAPQVAAHAGGLAWLEIYKTR